MAAASEVTFDVLLGGKVTPQLLKSFKDLEEMMKKQGATAKTINAVMGKAYKETFDGMSKNAKKDFEEVEKSGKNAFNRLVAKAHEAQKQISEDFERMRGSFEKFAELLKKPIEWIGLTGVLSAAGTALGGAELLKKGIEVHRARETQMATLQATLTGRGAGAQAPEWAEAAEKISQQAHVGHEEAMKLMTRLAVSGRFRTAEQAQQMAMSLIGLGGGTAEGAEAARAAYGKASLMMMAGRVRPTAIGAIAGGAGMGGALMQQLARDTGIPITDLTKAFAPAKVSKRGEVTAGALAGAKGIEALNKAILELGQNRGFEMIKAKMEGMEGMFYRFGEHWEDFTDKIGQAFEEFISPIADRVNELLDSINFEEVFNQIIEKAKEYGQLIKAVWDTVANSPVLKTVQAMWENFWRSLAGGAELYGPYIETWKDNLHHELGTVMARHPTKAFFALQETVGQKLGDAIKGLIDLMNKVAETWTRIQPLLEAFGKMLEMFKAIDDFLYGHLLPTLSNLSNQGFQQLVKFGEQLANVFKGLIDKIVSFIPDWLKAGPTGAQREATIESHAYARQAPYYGMQAQGTDDAQMKQIETLDKMNEMNEQLRKTQEQHKKAIEGTTGALYGQSPGFIPGLQAATDSILTSFLPAIQQAVASLSQIQPGMGGGMGGGYGGGGGMTEYGASVPGDQPGGPTYDWNSYHGIGAYTKNLIPGLDVAMHPEYARSHYGISPLGYYVSDKDHMRHRWADVTGSKDFANEDLYRGAIGGIFRKPTRTLIGESGPEAVLPLAGAGAALAGLGGITINVNVAGNAHDPEGIAQAVENVIRQHWRRQAVV